MERGQISDLVLLERIQKVEALMRDSFGSIKAALDANRIEERAQAVKATEGRSLLQALPIEARAQGDAPIASHIVSPTGELGSLPSITTPTELQVLTLLASEGPKSAPEIGKFVGRSREHSARLMKKLFEEGYVRRDQTRIPFRYSVVDRLRQSVKKLEPRDEAKEPISAPQT
jgi:DNA-binding MarR family transcriptional regulator